MRRRRSGTKIHNDYDVDLSSVTYFNNLFYAAGVIKQKGTEQGVILKSNDGYTWSIAYTTNRKLTAISSNNSAVIAVGEGICRSTNGDSWTEQAPARGDIYPYFAIANNGNSTWMATGHDRTTDYSTDNGVTWIGYSTAPVTGQWYGITFGSNIWMAASGHGTYAYTTTPGTWIDIDYFPQKAWMRDIAYFNSWFYAVGIHGVLVRRNISGNANDLSSSLNIDWKNWEYLYGIDIINNSSTSLLIITGDEGYIFTSLNGTTWTKKNSGTKKALKSATFGNGLYVIVGENSILISKELETWQNVLTF